MDEIRIEALVAREWNGVAQVLLVLVSVDAGYWASCPVESREVWVGLDASAPVRWDDTRVEWGDGASRGDVFSAARRMDDSEAEAFAGWGSPGGESLALPRGDARSLWLARFDLSVFEGLEQRWQRASSGPDPSPLTVTAWRAGCAAGPRAEPEALVPALSTYVCCGDVVSRTIAAADVVRQPLFEVGVLFVHGIGNHAVRETLLRFGEPLVDFWMKLLRTVSTAGASFHARTQRQEIRARVQQRFLRRLDDFDGVQRTLEHWADAGRPGPVASVNPPSGELLLATLRHEQTLFEQPGDMNFSATLFRLTRVHADAGLRESHLLLGEAHWVSQAVRPGLGELAAWLQRAMPCALQLHYAALGGLAHVLRQAPVPGGWARLATYVESGLLLPKVLLLGPVHVVLTVLLHWTVLLLGVVSLLPVGWLRAAAQGLTLTLLSTVGLSHALQASPIRRGAIVSRVKLQLDSLRGRCHRVVVVSHSQGAEVMRLVFQRDRYRELSQWVTLGAGIKPLNLLDYAALERPGARLLGQVFAGISGLAALAASGLAVRSIPGVGDVSPLLAATLDLAVWVTGIVVGTSAIALVVVALASAAAPAPHLNPAQPRFRLRSRKSVLRLLRDYFATHDPVPAGSMTASWSPQELDDNFTPDRRPVSIRIDNDRAGWSDHVAYWQNLEQFVAPLGLRLLQFAGVNTESKEVREVLARADRRRSDAVAVRYLVRVLALLICVAATARVAFGSPGRGAAWLRGLTEAWTQASAVVEVPGLWWRSGAPGGLLRDLVVPVAIAVAYAVWRTTYRWLLRRGQARFIGELAEAVRRTDRAPA